MTNQVTLVSDVSQTSVEDLAGICRDQFRYIDKKFEKIDDQFNEIRSAFATKADLNDLYRSMISRFDAMDARINRLEDSMNSKFDMIMNKIDAFVYTMTDHEGRINKLEDKSIGY